jgi:3-hydroxyacyl-[acyl-carrier-protein] dehydratase
MNQIEKEIRENIKKFRINDNERNIAEAYIFFPSDFIGFKGHFPDNPILPGICLVKALLVKLMIWKETSIRLKEMNSVKFFSPVQPGTILMFESSVVQEPDSDFCIVSSKVTCESRKTAQLKLKVTVNPTML